MWASGAVPACSAMWAGSAVSACSVMWAGSAVSACSSMWASGAVPVCRFAPAVPWRAGLQCRVGAPSAEMSPLAVRLNLRRLVTHKKGMVMCFTNGLKRAASFQTAVCAQTDNRRRGASGPRRSDEHRLAGAPPPSGHPIARQFVSSATTAPLDSALVCYECIKCMQNY